MIKLGYEPKLKHKWKILPKEFNENEYNGKQVMIIHELLWEKIKNIFYLRSKGYDSLILIDGKKRTGKSTLGMTIGYILYPKFSMKNFVAGLEEAPSKIDEAEDESVLQFDEGTLVASSKDAMAKKSKQLLKIFDVVGQKKLTLIFCMPSFFDINRQIAINHSLFLLHVYTDDRLDRGRFAYFSTKKKKTLYEIGKKNFGSYARPESDWTGRFDDFHLPFEEEYLKLKKESLKEALNPDAKKDKVIPNQIISKIKTDMLIQFKELCPEVPDRLIWRGFGIGSTEYYRRRKRYSTLPTS